MNAGIVGVYPVEVDFLGGGLDIIRDIIQGGGEVVDILTVERRDEVFSELSKNLRV